MVSAVTPWAVAPPLSDPAGHGTTHGGRHMKEIFSFFTAGSQSGAASAAAVPMPAPAAAAVALAAVVAPARVDPTGDAADDERRPAVATADGAVVAVGPDGPVGAVVDVTVFVGTVVAEDA